MSDLSSRFIANVEALRKAKNMSQAELSFLAGYEGNSTISKKLSGKSKISPEDMEAFARALDVPVEKLLHEIKHKERNSVMDYKEFYTYKNLGLDPHTCVLPTDNYLLTNKPDPDPDTATDIRDIIASFYAAVFEDYGAKQLYIWRAMDGTSGCAFSQVYYLKDGDQEHLSMIMNHDGKAEEEIIRTTINYISQCADPIDVTGIFVEVEPGQWMIVHDGLEKGEAGAYESQTCPFCGE